MAHLRRNTQYSSQEEQQQIAGAIQQIEEISKAPSDGKWLESLTCEVLPLIKRLDVEKCWSWKDWPERLNFREFDNIAADNHTIDCVALRRSDHKWIAIQCKSRELDEEGKGEDVGLEEISKFLISCLKSIFAECWLVTNGNFSITRKVKDNLANSGDHHLQAINLGIELALQNAAYSTDDECEHCSLGDNSAGAIRTKTCMQREVVNQCVKLLREQIAMESDGVPIGDARGRIILPCGTGKTRISLRIVEELTHPGDVSIVLCPSIALVAQIRNEYLQHSLHPIRPLAVCSDKTAGYAAEGGTH